MQGDGSLKRIRPTEVRHRLGKGLLRWIPNTVTTRESRVAYIGSFVAYHYYFLSLRPTVVAPLSYNRLMNIEWFRCFSENAAVLNLYEEY